MSQATESLHIPAPSRLFTTHARAAPARIITAKKFSISGRQEFISHCKQTRFAALTVQLYASTSSRNLAGAPAPPHPAAKMTNAKRSASSKCGKSGDGNAAAPRTTVDLSKLRKTSLKKYKRHFNLDCKADSKSELLAAVMAHFSSMMVKEADVALAFHNFARSVRGRRTLAGGEAKEAVAVGGGVPEANGR